MYDWVAAEPPDALQHDRGERHHDHDHGHVNAHAPGAWLTLQHTLLDGQLDFDLGEASSAMGDHRQALVHHGSALATRAKVLPADHTDIARSHSALGGTHSTMGNNAEAARHHSAALAILQKAPAANSSDSRRVCCKRSQPNIVIMVCWYRTV